MIIGIDTGFDGAIALLSADGQDLSTKVMPIIKRAKGRPEYDAHAIIEMLNEAFVVFSARVVYCEKLQPLPAKMGGSIANYRRGIWLAFQWTCAALKIPFVAVRPQEWMKEFDISGDAGGTKNKAYEVASRRWPTHDWRASPRCRNFHTGLVDAALVAEYGRRKEGGQ